MININISIINYLYNRIMNIIIIICNMMRMIIIMNTFATFNMFNANLMFVIIIIILLWLIILLFSIIDINIINYVNICIIICINIIITNMFLLLPSNERASPHGAQELTGRAKERCQPLMIGRDRPEHGQRINNGARHLQGQMSHGCKRLWSRHRGWAQLPRFRFRGKVRPQARSSLTDSRRSLADGSRRSLADIRWP